jgi:hypothetical protein
MKLIPIIFIVILIYILFNSSNVQKFSFLVENEPYFLTKKETIDFFIKDSDKYIEKLTNYDLMSLNATSKDNYLQKSINVASNFTDTEKNKLSEATQKADEYFLSMNDIPYIDKYKLANMKWNFSKTLRRDYEAGYPHTREDTIFLPEEILNIPMKDLTRTLIHEKVHVYQRLHHDDFLKWTEYNDYKRFKRFEDYPMRRSNPDLDGIVYLDKTGKETLAMFNTLTPKSIDEATYPQPGKYGYMSESPIETLAYFIDFDYAGEKFPYNYLVEDTIKYQKERGE